MANRETKKSTFKSLYQKLENLIFPEGIYCVCCGNIIDETRTYSLCDHCMKHIRWYRGNPIFDDGIKIISCMEYGIYERNVIFNLKYNGKKFIARHCADIMKDKLLQLKEMLTESPYKEGLPYDFITPVPIHRNKLKNRGFNQSALIAHFLSEKTGIDCIENLLIKRKETLPMKNMNKQERLDAMQGAIEINDRYKDMIGGKSILLIDDFFTTGSTAISCHKALKPFNPSSLTLLTFAGHMGKRF